MHRLVLGLAVFVLVVASSGCQLCLLPCYVCLSTGELAGADDAARALPEVQPALLAAHEAEAAQLSAR